LARHQSTESRLAAEHRPIKIA